MYRDALRFMVAVLISLNLTTPAAAQDLWRLIAKGGHPVFLRHANAPGNFEDPPGIDLKDCKMQRNLDDIGRAQARQIGDLFRKHGMRSARLIASRFCRAIDTARLMKLGPVEEQPLLNFIKVDDKFALGTYALRMTAWLKGLPANRPMVLVSHITNIEVLTGERPASAEMVVTRFDGGKIVAVGKVPPP